MVIWDSLQEAKKEKRKRKKEKEKVKKDSRFNGVYIEWGGDTAAWVCALSRHASLALSLPISFGIQKRCLLCLLFINKTKILIKMRQTN